MLGRYLAITMRGSELVFFLFVTAMLYEKISHKYLVSFFAIQAFFSIFSGLVTFYTERKIYLAWNENSNVPMEIIYFFWTSLASSTLLCNLIWFAPLASPFWIATAVLLAEISFSISQTLTRIRGGALASILVLSFGRAAIAWPTAIFASFYIHNPANYLVLVLALPIVLSSLSSSLVWKGISRGKSQLAGIDLGTLITRAVALLVENLDIILATQLLTQTASQNFVLIRRLLTPLKIFGSINDVFIGQNVIQRGRISTEYLKQYRLNSNTSMVASILVNAGFILSLAVYENSSFPLVQLKFLEVIYSNFYTALILINYYFLIFALPNLGRLHLYSGNWAAPLISNVLMVFLLILISLVSTLIGLELTSCGYAATFVFANIGRIATNFVFLSKGTANAICLLNHNAFIQSSILIGVMLIC